MLGAERFQDTEASLAGDDGRYDPGNPGKAVEAYQVAVRQVAREWAIPVNTMGQKNRPENNISLGIQKSS